jgi:hypothetical protein
MIYIVFDTLTYDPKITYVGTIEQCYNFVTNAYGTDDYRTFLLSSEHGSMIDQLTLNNFENSPYEINLKEEMYYKKNPRCDLCEIKYEIGTSVYCENCRENYKNEFCDRCGKCVSTDVEYSKFKDLREKGYEIYCDNCNN